MILNNICLIGKNYLVKEDSLSGQKNRNIYLFLCWIVPEKTPE